MTDKPLLDDFHGLLQSLVSLLGYLTRGDGSFASQLAYNQFFTRHNQKYLSMNA
jgi:hypothetical protein